MLSQVIWSQWARAPTVVDPKLEVATSITFEITQPFEGVGLRVLFLMERVRCQLVGEDASWVPLDPSKFMLTLLSMTDAEYHLWRADISYAEHFTDGVKHDEFSETHLTSALI